MLTENDIIDYAVLARVKGKDGGDDWFQVVLSSIQHDSIEGIVLTGRSIKLHEKSIRDKLYAEIAEDMVGG